LLTSNVSSVNLYKNQTVVPKLRLVLEEFENSYDFFEDQDR